MFGWKTNTSAIGIKPVDIEWKKTIKRMKNERNTTAYVLNWSHIKTYKNGKLKNAQWSAENELKDLIY